MIATIVHRGPDDSGTHFEPGIGLGFQRLAIIDLSAAGHQPMTNEDGSLMLVFNGEIYNYVELRRALVDRGHRFRSQTDSEVILHAFEEYGRQCVHRFNGMFAFALWNRRDRSLFIARDRLGVKPLYYTELPHGLAFASEIKALLELPHVRRRANPIAIAQYLRHTFSIDDSTWFEGIRKLLPGQCAVVDQTTGLRISTYWDPVDRFRYPQTEDDYPAQVRHLLSDSVRLRLRSDVPVGAHLSGGLDSSTIVALMRNAGADELHTFSGAFSEGGEYDERHWINLVVQACRTAHHEVTPDRDDFVELLPKLTWHMDEPQVGPGLFPQFHVCRLTAESGVKVVHGGQGGDELFGGYPKYFSAYLSSPAHSAPGKGWFGRLGTVGRLGPVMLRQTWSGRRFRSAAARSLTRTATGQIDPTFTTALKGYRPALPRVIADDLANEMYNDLRWYLPALLHVEDRTSMAVSIESRTPLLDYRVVELASQIPIWQKMQHGRLKAILRDAMMDLLPLAISSRRDKRGFPTPIGTWFATPTMARWLTDLLAAPAFTATRIYSPRYLNTLIRLQRSGAADVSGQLWPALSIALWFSVFDAEPVWA